MTITAVLQTYVTRAAAIEELGSRTETSIITAWRQQNCMASARTAVNRLRGRRWR